MAPEALSVRVKRYVKDSGVGKGGACHAFRHAMATAMLEGGADVRYVQEMLGHAALETTAIYTRVSVSKLREVYMAAHPTARLGKPRLRPRVEEAPASATGAGGPPRGPRRRGRGRRHVHGHAVDLARGSRRREDRRHARKG
jgi:hypothetical protein